MDTPGLVDDAGTPIHAPDPGQPLSAPWLTSDASLSLSRVPVYLNRLDFEDPSLAPADENLFEFSGMHTFEFQRLAEPSADAGDNLRIRWAQNRDPAEPDDSVTARTTNCYVIDLAPGVFPNAIKSRIWRGRVDVAIPTTLAFRAADVKHSSVRLGAVTPSAKPLQTRMTDVDGDGDQDLVLQFDTSAAGIVCGSTIVSLTAKTTHDRTISGTDSLVPVACP